MSAVALASPRPAVCRHNHRKPRADMHSGTDRKTIWLILTAYLAVVGIMLFWVLQTNQGRFVYSLDDPYIHLALARNLAHGHYGINTSEYSAPSSSIVWPVLLAPFANSVLGEYIPLILCVICSLASVSIVIHRLGGRVQPALLAIGVVVLTNQVGLIFTGMEHSLQILLAVTAAVGVLEVHEENRVSPWLMGCLIAGPLVRYENLAITLPVCAYLWVQGYRRIALIGIAVPLFGIFAFSLFLKSMGLGMLPSSVVAKSGAGTQSNPIHDLLSNFKRNLLFEGTRLQVFTFVGVLALLGFTIKQMAPPVKVLAMTALGAGVLHLFLGRFGWAGRYEQYAVAYIGIILLASWRLTDKAQRFAIPLAIGLIPLALFNIIRNTLAAPTESHGIYLQQYQMHRFAIDSWKRPVAVNDLGWVSWENASYVLDLYGLGNYQALKLRTSQTNPEWMNALCRKHNVDLAMVYDNWFPGKPPGWIKIATLTRHLSSFHPNDQVSIYATQESAVQELRAELIAFAPSLPTDASLEILPM